MPTLKVIGSLALAFAVSARADDVYFAVPVTGLTLTAGELPVEGASGPRWDRVERLSPYAVLDGPGEAFVTLAISSDDSSWIAPWSAERAMLVVRAERPGPVTGMLYVPDAEWEGLTPLAFSIPAEAATAEAKAAFARAGAERYEGLRARNVPGGPWFRHRADALRATLGEEATPDVRRRPVRFDEPTIGDTYNLFTGGRAVAENLQLPRGLPEAAGPEESKPPVPVGSIEGITVRAFDWTRMLGAEEGSAIAVDALARSIPADQHAAFLPSLKALIRVLDDTDEDGLPVFRAARPRSEDARLIARYQRQLCLPATLLARALGPGLVRSVAVTGSDPYFPTGTDVAVLLESADPERLRGLVLAQVMMASAAEPGSEAVTGEVGDVKFDGAVSPGREVCAYVAAVGPAVVVTNSKAQLARLAAVAAGAEASLGSLDEYRYFRARYRAGAAGETAFVFLSDPTIRRWCGPEWRIGASRRLRAAAVMSDLTAAHADAIVAGSGDRVEVKSDVPMQTIGTLTLGPGGVRSSVYGRGEFLTPIIELGIDEVTAEEAAAYGRWGDGYQRNWSWAFDPIGVSFGLSDTAARADLTVMPLIMATRYATWMSVARGATVGPRAGDPHDALVHGVMAVNIESEAARNAAGMARMFAPELNIDPLGWLGESVALYADPDPFWDEMINSGEPEDYLGEHIGSLPVAVHAEVSSPLKLTAFLAAARTFIEQSAPGMTSWTTLRHGEQPYVRVGVSETARAEAPGAAMNQVAIYYAATPRALIASFNEGVLMRALDRLAAKPPARAEEHGEEERAPYWLGGSMGLRFNEAGLALVQGPGGRLYRAAMQERAWSNLPILNEWKRRYPERDPVEVHERLFGVRLIDPAGGRYTWNETFRTMESSSYGHPGEAKPGPDGLGALGVITGGNLGLTFEDNGLRARAELERKQPAGTSRPGR